MEEAPMPPLLAFTSEHVQRLTHLAASTLRYWEETDVFRASHVDERPHRPYRRLYTFSDLVGLRTLALLRREYKISLDELRTVGQYLAAHHQRPWSEARFGVQAGHVVFPDPISGSLVAGKPFGQAVIEIDVQAIARGVEADAAKLRERLPEDVGKIARRRYVQQNAWVVAGTRIPTSAIWKFHAAGYDTDAIIEAYPRLTPEDVAAALEHEQPLLQEHAA
jgi:DNA-binding transcriptional MerR regulator